MLVNEVKALTKDPGVQSRNREGGRFRREKNRSLPSSTPPVVSKLSRDSLDSKRNPAETSSAGGQAKHTLAHTADDTNLASPACSSTKCAGLVQVA